MHTRYEWAIKDRRAARKLREEQLSARGRVIELNTHDMSRLAQMAPRSLRRIKQGDDFRPVYHHGIPTKIEHKAVIAAMKIHKKGRKAAQRWQPQVNLARSMVSFGLAIKLFLGNLKKEATELRHATLKANGLWVNHAVR